MMMNKSAQRVDANALYKHPTISLRIKELQKQKNKVSDEEFNIDAAWVLTEAHEIYKMCKGSTKPKYRGGEPVLDDEGDQVYEFKEMGALKALDCIGKHIDVQAFKDTLVLENAAELSPWVSIKASVDKNDDSQ